HAEAAERHPPDGRTARVGEDLKKDRDQEPRRARPLREAKHLLLIGPVGDHDGDGREEQPPADQPRVAREPTSFAHSSSRTIVAAIARARSVCDAASGWVEVEKIPSASLGCRRTPSSTRTGWSEASKVVRSDGGRG